MAKRKKSGRTHLDVLKRGGFDGITRKKAAEPFVRLLRTLDINVECKVVLLPPSHVVEVMQSRANTRLTATIWYTQCHNLE